MSGRADAADAPLTMNPYAHEFHDDPFPIYRRLRDEAPCYRNDELGFWALSRYDDVLVALHDTDTYASRYGITLESSTSLPMLITTDPPEHTQLRRLVSRAFTPRRISDLEVHIRARATHYLDAIVPAGEADIIEDYAAKLPMDVISEMLGVAGPDRDMLRSWTDAMLHREPGQPEVTPEGIEAGSNLHAYFSELVRAKRGVTTDDLTSALLATELDGERLADEWVVGFCFLLIIAGNETTTKLLANCLLALQRFPDQRAKLLAGPARIPDAVEEILRHEGSTQFMARTVARPVALHGESMREGDRVLLLLGSANRDERVFERPDEFDIDRPRDAQHVGLGHGVHVCLGAALARLEMRVSLEEILRRIPEYTIDEARLERVHSGNVRGYARMPLTFRPQRSG